MKGRLARFGVLALTAAGFFALAKGRPRDLSVEIDLSAARPAAIRTVDLTLRREGIALLRREQQFGPAGAPASLVVTTRTTPGPAELEVTVVDRAGSASRERLQVELREAEEGAQPPRVQLPVR
jgi:hypothetical protein